MKPIKFRKSGRCEQCNNKYRVRGDVNDHCSTNYKEWMEHNREVQKTRMGAEVCWYCFRYGKNREWDNNDKSLTCP